MSWNYKDWYEENREELLARRRATYRSNPEYREKRIEDAKERYRRTRRHREIEDRRVIQREDEQFYSIGRLGEIIDRSIQTIREYHRNDVIPAPTHFDSRGWRLYSISQVELLRRTFAAFDRSEFSSLSEVARVLAEEWHNEESTEGQRSFASA